MKLFLCQTQQIFSAVGENKLRDVFLQADGSYSAELDHTYNNTNIEASWNGASSSFQNSSGTSLQDSSAGVQKVMYPFSFTQRVFWWGNSALSVPTSLTMSSSDIDAMGIPTAQERMARIDQFRPALQIKTFLQKS